MKTKDIFLYALALAFLVAFILLSWFLRETDNQTARDVVTTMRDGIILILGYFFGSSKGSSDKTELMNKEK